MSQLILTGLLVAAAWSALRALQKAGEKRREQVAEFARKATVKPDEPRDMGTLRETDTGVYEPDRPQHTR